MNFRQITWGVGLLGALALPGCGGDDTPTPTGWEEAGVVGAGGAGNDASVVGNDSSTGKAGGNASDSGGDGAVCKKTAAMAVTGQDISSCKAGLAEAGDDGGADCFACLCTTCPLEAKACIGNSNCSTITDCCRAACSCPVPAHEAGSDAPAASEGGGNSDAASTTDSPAGDGAAE